MNLPKRVAIKTYGCQMNVYDSQQMLELLTPLGYTPTEDVSVADLVIINTCHIREKAAEKVYSELGKLRQLKEKKLASGSKMLLAVAGCVGQAEGGEVLRRSPAVDIVVGPQSYQRLPDILVAMESHGGRALETSLSVDGKFEHLDYLRRSPGIARGVTAFVTVQEGCDKFCTFCVVPYTRGAEFSRPVDTIEQEVRRLAECGVREITLLGQNVNAYHGELSTGKKCTLGSLINRLSQIDGVDRIRYTTSHPCDMHDDLLEAHQFNSKLMPYVHLPLQSGSDKILKLMNRQYTAQKYVDTVVQLRKIRPDLAVSSDFIVGFPGETESDFLLTLEIVDKIGYAQAFSFKYSPRPGTPSSTWANQIDGAVKSERLQQLQSVLGIQQKQFNQSCVGRNLSVLLEKKGRHAGQLVGRSPYLQAVFLEDSHARIGKIVETRITGVSSNSLAAQAIGER